jgi:hypothetical protein
MAGDWSPKGVEFASQAIIHEKWTVRRRYPGKFIY